MLLPGFRAVLRRETTRQLTAPRTGLAAIAFPLLAAAATFGPGQWLERGRADLDPFFAAHPWLYLGLAALLATARRPVDGRDGGLPIPLGQAVLASFLAGWLMLAAMLVLTLPMVAALLLLGEPDLGVVLAGYLASWAVGGVYLALGLAAGAACRDPAIALLTAVALGLIVTVAGPLAAMAPDAPGWLIAAAQALTLPERLARAARGLLDPRDPIFVVGSIALFLYAATVLADLRRAGGR